MDVVCGWIGPRRHQTRLDCAAMSHHESCEGGVYGCSECETTKVFCVECGAKFVPTDEFPGEYRCDDCASDVADCADPTQRP